MLRVDGAAEASRVPPTFTVVINTYNYLRFLPEAVASVAAQTFPDYELIIVDDGSTDGSLAYLDALDVPHRLVRTGRLGQARACLRAIGQARGRYVHILDADDLAAPDLLATVAPHLVGNPSKVQFQLVPVTEDGRPFAPPYPSFPPGYDARAQRRDIRRTGLPLSPPTSGNVFRRDVFDTVGDIAYETAIDGATLLVAPFLGEVVTIPAPLGSYRVHRHGHSAHADPLDPARIRRDRERFGCRLDHLGAILARLRPAEPGITAGHRFLFHWDQLTMEAVAGGTRALPGMAAHFVGCLLRQHGATPFAARKLAWLFVALVAPKSVRARMLTARLNPWPRRAAALIRGAVPASRPLPAGAAEARD